jgi:hypothetical protein
MDNQLADLEVRVAEIEARLGIFRDQNIDPVEKPEPVEHFPPHWFDL